MAKVSILMNRRKHRRGVVDEHTKKHPVPHAK